MKLKKISKMGIFALLMTGCGADPYNQGNYVDIATLKGKEGIWSKADVEQTIGSPSFVDPTNSLVVYYVGAQGYKYPVVSPTINKALTLKVEYDANQRLKNFSEIE
jgi:outer membrane protein assembly factor BamE (lipoprotein component of BamABCDE complex)